MAPVLRYDHDTLEQQLKDTIQSLYQILVQVSTYDNTTASSISTPLHPSSISSPAPAVSASPYTASASASASTRSPASAAPATSSRDVLANEIRALERSLQAVHRTATTPSAEASLPPVPPELIQYVEGGRNPDIYTREFVELVRRGNQLVRGKQAAFASFRDVLAAEMEKAMPELRDDAARVVAATTPAPAGSGEGSGGGGGGGMATGP
ncbi:RNA polymerase II mediator complex subunit [Diatrype stigma]|uniref:Mediator of RNA polymerase II transcription subunit 10 n=1 Tax=Diatrype stigma TaxID=117547 RepID=A0AAN9UZE5_9PEZI